VLGDVCEAVMLEPRASSDSFVTDSGTQGSEETDTLLSTTL